MSDTLATAAARWRNLPPALAVDAARQDQDERWARGDRPPAEAYLAALPRLAASPDDALVLIYGEVMNRAALGETADAGEYAARFPQYADRLAAIFAVHGGLSFGPVEPPRAAVPDHPPAPPVIPGFSDFEYVGRGGIGVVYRATMQATGRSVAVKLVDEAAAVPDVLIRFLQEAEILARLDHPNIVRLVATGSAAGRPYIASEWVGGGTLAARIGGRRRPWPEAVGLVATLADALHHAHQRGVVHRDLKPSNILLRGARDEGQGAGVEQSGRLSLATFPLVSDFGVARLMRSGGLMSSSGQLIGTPAYMPPEQIEGRHRDVGPAADVYALGAVLYEMLTGRPPFAGSDRLDLFRRVLTEPPHTAGPVRGRRSDLPQEKWSRS
jgi:eukaryotic-like serine/threonine-protein kinase